MVQYCPDAPWGMGTTEEREYRLDVLTLTLYKEEVADSRSRTDVKIVNKMRTPSRSFILVPIFILHTPY